MWDRSRERRREGSHKWTFISVVRAFDGSPLSGLVTVVQ